VVGVYLHNRNGGLELMISLLKSGAVKLTGDRALLRKLKALGNTHESDIVAAITKGAKIIEAEAKSRAPRGKTGILKDSIDSGQDKKAARPTVLVSWRRGGPSRTDAFYGLFLERGTKPRVRTKYAKKRMRKAAYTGRVRPMPFLEPAFDQKKDQAQRVIKAELKKLIEKTAMTR